MLKLEDIVNDFIKKVTPCLHQQLEKLTEITKDPIPYSKLRNCPDCAVKPGQIHKQSCDVERCSVCGGQRLMAYCEGHDQAFARWTGFWPGTLEAKELKLDLNEFYEQEYEQIFFVKPI
jgi:hypothetical protein